MRTKIILAVALLMGLVTTVLFINYMKKYDDAKVASTTMVSVVAAKQAVKADTMLSADMLEVIQVPQQGAGPQAVRSTAEAVGKVTDTALVPGEVVQQHHLESQQEESLYVSKKVQPGYRAISVEVNLVGSVSNLIEPDDYVDVVATIADKQASDKPVSTIVLEHARVLAIGRRMVGATTDTPYVEYSSVTLEVKPQDGLNVINADERGTISLMLNGRVVAETPQK